MDLCLKFLQTHCTLVLIVLFLNVMMTYGKRFKFIIVILFSPFSFLIFAKIMPQSEKVVPKIKNLELAALPFL